MSYMPPPVVIYPSSESTATQASSHSNDSFTPVFVVLAVIIVLLGSSCCIGQVCARRVAKPKSKKQHEQPKSKKQHEQPKTKQRKQNFNDGEEDIEFGFKNKRVPSAKAAYHDIPLVMPTKEPRHPKNGEAKREVRFAEHGEPKACTWSEG